MANLARPEIQLTKTKLIKTTTTTIAKTTKTTTTTTTTTLLSPSAAAHSYRPSNYLRGISG